MMVSPSKRHPLASHGTNSHRQIERVQSMSDTFTFELRAEALIVREQSRMGLIQK
jgi:hypothetical protein